MRGIALNAHIQDLNNKQPEFVKPIWEYLDSAVSDKRVEHGREKLAANATMLANLQSRFGIPKEILVAIWGIETNYGSQAGRYNMFEALATLGYDGRRAQFGRRELIAALTMEQREGYRPEQMLSSWAGAFGQTQFMPSDLPRTCHRRRRQWPHRSVDLAGRCAGLDRLDARPGRMAPRRALGL